MLYVYGYTDGNAREAVREYQRRFPHRRVPGRQTIVETYRRARETGSLAPPRREIAAPVVEGIENRVLASIENDPTTSTRRIGYHLNVSHASVHRVLKRNELYPFHLTKVQHLLDGDYARRIEFCRWYLDQPRTAVFRDSVMWTDEAMFTRSGTSIVTLH